MQEEVEKAVSPLPGDFGGQRTMEMAVQAYERTLECARIIKEKNQVMA